VSEEYLWDKSGEPDREIVELEELLRPFRDTRGMREPIRRRAWVWIPVGMAAAIGLVCFFVWRQARTTGPAWEVASISGTVHQKELRAGDWLETGAAKVELDLDSTGEVEVEPDSRVRLVRSGKDRQQLALARGTLRATIWAPPGEFSVATPSATAVDLGCIYTLVTDAQGNGLVRVEMGWVAFEDYGRESFIPEGAVCHTSARRGPGIPYFESTSPVLRQLVKAMDDSGNPEPLSAALGAATRQDGVTLWHLLRRVPVDRRGLVYDRFGALLPVPASVTREDAIHLNAKAMDTLWDSLGYGDTDWWRMWKRHEFSR
jgi:hypothetical protein